MVLASLIPSLTSAEIQWWLLALLFYGAGDYITTVVAVRRADIVEANPAIRLLLSEQPSPIGFAVVKSTALLICFLGFLSIYESAIAIGIPVMITMLGVLVTAVNLRTLARSSTQLHTSRSADR